MSTTAPGASGSGAQTEVGGWAIFAACILLISGVFGVVWGLAALLNDEVLTVGGKGVIVWDFTAWGWIHLLVGVVMIATAWGLFSGAGWSRWTAVLFAMVQAFIQVGAFTAFPLWSVVVIALDVTVIYQLTAKWQTGY